MYGKFQTYLQQELKAIDQAGLYKRERTICSPQGAEITLEDGSKALNFCANNYLGRSDNPCLIAAAKKASAPLLGVRKLVLKCHGKAKRDAVCLSLCEAHSLLKQNIQETIEKAVEAENARIAESAAE